MARLAISQIQLALLELFLTEQADQRRPRWVRIAVKGRCESLHGLMLLPDQPVGQIILTVPESQVDWLGWQIAASPSAMRHLTVQRRIAR